MKAKEYLKESGVPKIFTFQKITHHGGGFTVESVTVKLDEFIEDYAEKKAIDFLKFDDLGDKNCRHLTDKDYEELYQVYYNQNKDEN